MTRLIVAALALVLLGPVSTWAADILTVTDRSVITARVQAENDLGTVGDGDGAVLQAPGGDWTVQQDVTLPLVDLSLRHQITITPLGFTVSSQMDGVAHHIDELRDELPINVFGKASVTEHLILQIDIAVPVTFQFLASASVVTDEEAQITGRFIGDEWWTEDNHGDGDPLQAPASGHLQPGRYFLTIDTRLRANGSLGFPVGRYAYALSLAVEPVP